MSQRIRVGDPILSTLALADVTSYLRAEGWSIGQRSAREVAFNGPQDDSGVPLTVTLPTSENFVDWKSRVVDVVNVVSALREQAPDFVIAQMRGHWMDLLSVVVVDSRTSSGSIPFGDARTLIYSHWSLLSFAACLEEDPQPYFRKARAIGKQQADRFRLGHTVRGSFGITIESTLPPTPASLRSSSDGLLQPIERRIVERIVTGLSDLETSLVTGDVEPLATHYEQGMNANMCDALIELGTTLEGSDLQYGVSWSPAFPPRIASRKTMELPVNAKTLEYLEAASKVLRRDVEVPDTEVVGRITKLQAERPPDDVGDEMAVTVAGQVNGKETLHVRVLLSALDYKSACDAHRDGRNVAVSGSLQKIGKFWSLLVPKNFRVLP